MMSAWFVVPNTTVQYLGKVPDFTSVTVVGWAVAGRTDDESLVIVRAENSVITALKTKPGYEYIGNNTKDLTDDLKSKLSEWSLPTEDFRQKGFIV